MSQAEHSFKTFDISKTIVSNIDRGIMVLDDELTIYFFNTWLEKSTNVKKSSILGKKIYEVFDTINQISLLQQIKNSLSTRLPTNYILDSSNYLIPIKTDESKKFIFKYMQQDVSIVPFDKGESLVALIITDQTELLNTNALLKKNIEKIKELNADLVKEKEIINKKILFTKFDNSGKIFDVSQSLIDLLMYEKQDIIGQNYFIHQKQNMSQDLQAEIVSHMRNLKVFTFEKKAQTAENKEIWVKNTLVPEYDSKGNHTGFIIFGENITDSKTLAQNNEKLLLNSRSAAMGEMVGMIAHQWRQPLSLLNTIIATLQIKKELNTLDDATINESYNKIKTTTKFLSETIDDFKNYFKPNKLSSEVEIRSLFDKSIYFLVEEMAQLGIDYMVEGTKEIKIQTYKNELLQSIINIIKNSIDSFREHEIENKKISINIQDHEDHVWILIKDNAGGIKHDILNKVFEPYFSTKSNNGSGLGLYMCHTIITQHLKGSITMSSEDKTTTTLIELPYSI